MLGVTLLTFALAHFMRSVHSAEKNSAILNATAVNQATGTSSSKLVATARLQGSFDVSGSVSFTLNPTSNSSNEVMVKVSVTGLMALNSSAEYAYHIHTNPISWNGNCSSALGHLDPLKVTDSVVCDPLVPQYCEMGDLSGRNGKLVGNVSEVEVSYVDPFLRFWPQPFSLLGRSIVVHAPNSTRIACGNITSVIDGTADQDGMSTNKSSNYVTQYLDHTPAAPAAKFTPFVGSSTITAAIATMTLPAALPDVKSIPNAYLTLAPVPQPLNTKLMTATLMAAIPAATGYNYTAGSRLPSQQDFAVNPNATNTTLTNSLDSKKSNAPETRFGTTVFSLSISVVLCNVLLPLWY